MRDYLAFARENRRFLAFGFFLTFFSSFGQTFLVSLFGPALRGEFRLSHGDFGLLYSLATLASGLSLMWVGKLIDRVSLRRFALVVAGSLCISCFLLAGVASVATLSLALFALRFSGQGLMSHTGLTSMARYFEEGRGKAISLAMLGFPAGQAVFPLAIVALTGAIGWRLTWVAIGAGLVIALLPLVVWLLRGHEDRHRRWVDRLRAGEGDPAAASGRHQWRRREVLRDRRFWIVLPAVLAPTFLLTGLIFHQAHLADEKGWSLAWLATCFIGLSATQVAGSLLAGPLVDRFGSPRLLPFFLIPLGLGLTALALFDAPVVAMIYMVLSGFTAGSSGPIAGALWAEVYGVAHLGAIRSMTSAIMVLSTAASPFGMGWLIDRDVSMEVLSGFGVLQVVVGSVLTIGAYRSVRAPIAQPEG